MSDPADINLPDWSDAHVIVVGLTDVGFSQADVLLDRGAHVTVVGVVPCDDTAGRVELLEFLGARVETELPREIHDPCDLILVSDGVPPNAQILADAARSGIPVLSDVQLMRLLEKNQPLLGVTGPGSADTVLMLEHILYADGKTSSAVGTGVRPILETVLDETKYDVLAVRLTAQQLHWSQCLHLHSSCVLDIDGDETGWYEELTRDDPQGISARDAQEADVARIFYRTQHCAFYNVEQPFTERMLEEADVVDGARAIGITTRVPEVSMMGVVDELIVDRAFIPQRWDSALEMARVSDLLADDPLTVRAALAAVGLARSFGVTASAVADGLQSYRQWRMGDGHDNDQR